MGFEIRPVNHALILLLSGTNHDDKVAGQLL